jgi:ABC-type Co2+ transport system permease subunit
LSLTTFLATFLALFLSTLSMIGVVSLGTSHYGELIHREEGGGIFEFKLLQEEEAHPEGATGEKEVNLGRFVAVVLPLGLIGWVLEGIITMLMVRYIHRLRPDLLGLEGEAP